MTGWVVCMTLCVGGVYICDRVAPTPMILMLAIPSPCVGKLWSSDQPCAVGGWCVCAAPS